MHFKINIKVTIATFCTQRKILGLFKLNPPYTDMEDDITFAKNQWSNFLHSMVYRVLKNRELVLYTQDVLFIKPWREYQMTLAVLSFNSRDWTQFRANGKTLGKNPIRMSLPSYFCPSLNSVLNLYVNSRVNKIIYNSSKYRYNCFCGYTSFHHLQIR